MTLEEQALVCEWLGIPAKREWWIFLDGSKVRDFRSEHGATLALRDYRKNDYERNQKWERATVESVLTYPNLLDWEGFGLMLRAAKERNIIVTIWSMASDELDSAELLTPEGKRASDDSNSLPEALARACLELARKEKT
jgi:hypothetical protein